MRQCRKDAEIHKANGLAAALQADKTKKSFWQKVNNKNRSPSLPTLVGGANGGSEIVKMWKDYFKGILNSENSGNGSAESVEHSIDCKESYLGLEMPMCSFVSLASPLQKLPLNKAPGSDCISAEHLLYANESLRLFLSELFNMCIVHGYCSSAVAATCDALSITSIVARKLLGASFSLVRKCAGKPFLQYIPNSCLKHNNSSHMQKQEWEYV